MTHRLAALALVLFAACDESDTPDPDAGPVEHDAAVPVDAGEPVNVEPPIAPAPPAPPVFTPCPTGWAESAEDGVVTCEPWPEGRPHCTGATAAWPGAAACEPVGTACPDDGWPSGLPEGATVVRVRAGAKPGGDGTADLPFDTIAAALAAAPPGAIVALARGRYGEAVVLASSVTLWGACTAETSLEIALPDPLVPVVRVDAPDVTIRNVTVRGSGPGIVLQREPARASLVDVLVEGASTHGIAVRFGSSLEGRGVVVRSTQPDPDGNFGRGLTVEYGSTATLERVVIEASRDHAVYAADEGTSLSLTDAALLDTEAGGNGVNGRGIEVVFGADASLVRTVVDSCRDTGLIVGFHSGVQLDQLVIRRVADSADGIAGRGIDIELESTVEGARLLVDEGREVGLFASDSTVELAEVVVRRQRGDAAGFGGRGIVIGEGATATLRRVHLADDGEIALSAAAVGASVEVTDARMLRTRAEADGGGGWGLSAQDGATLSAERVQIEDCREVGLAVIAADAELRDVEVRNTAGHDGFYGRGISVDGGGHMVLERALLAENEEAALFGGDGARLEVTDLLVFDTRSSAAGPGRGISIQGGATASIARARLERNHEIGIFAAEEATALVATDLEVLDTLERGCDCGDFRAGIGLGAYLEANIAAERFRVATAALAGVQIARGGTADLRTGEVSGCPIGVNLQTEGFDLTRLTDEVAYRDNERNFDGAELPTPAMQ